MSALGVELTSLMQRPASANDPKQTSVANQTASQIQMIFACLQVFAVDYASCGQMQDAPGRRRTRVFASPIGHRVIS